LFAVANIYKYFLQTSTFWKKMFSFVIL
jgi:hypothetical protein